MKQVVYRTLGMGDRFYQDHQWWVKLDDKSARHASQAMYVDMRPASKVLVRGDDPTPTGPGSDARRKMEKREGVFLLLGIFFESFKWFG
ncbi:hypothetical protein [Pseudomonas sp. NPDC008258]|uniref:hypothetical protein n=1 Tax=Pseudomonas sp. NPDC008258 TaxID=3364418 RepID=UPI0036E97EA2